MNKKLNNFTLVELLIVIAILGILVSLLIPSLSKARLSSQSAVCKSNLKQMYIGQMLYGKDNRTRVMATEYGAEWMMANSYVDFNDNNSWKKFHDGSKGFLEPYTGPNESMVYRCPASSYDKTSRFVKAHKGRSYSGFTSRNWRHPYRLEDMHIVRAGRKNFKDASRKPFFWDYNAALDHEWWMGTNWQIHGNTGFLNLCITDGTVVRAQLPIELWNKFATRDWVPFLERAVGESAN